MRTVFSLDRPLVLTASSPGMFRRTSQRLLSKLSKYAEKWWFIPLTAFLSAADAFIVVVPNEVFLITAVLAHPRRWITISLAVTLGSALGAAVFAELLSLYGGTVIEFLSPGLTRSHEWLESARFIQRHSHWGLPLISLSPFPQHAAVAILGLARVPAPAVFVGVAAGRGIKYVLIAWVTNHAPRQLKKLGLWPTDAADH